MASTTKWPDVREIPIDKPPNRAPRNQEIPYDDDMGFNDPANVLYVNMTGPDLGVKFKDRIDELTQMLQLTHQLATIHAGIQVKRRKAAGELPTDRSNASGWIRAQYRARVLDHYFNNGTYAWCVMIAQLLKLIVTQGSLTVCQDVQPSAQPSFQDDQRRKDQVPLATSRQHAGRDSASPATCSGT